MQPPFSGNPSDSHLDSAHLAASFQTLALSPDSSQTSSCSVDSYHPFKPTKPHHHLSSQYPYQSFYPQHTSPSPDYHYQPQHTPVYEQLPTEAELSRRARAAAGLNVSAPEFIPSFALKSSPPQQPQPQYQSFYQYPNITQYHGEQYDPTSSPYHHQATFDVYSNVTDPTPPVIPAPSAPQPNYINTEDAVDAFDRQFPALPSASSTPPAPQVCTRSAQALAWDALQRTEAQKAQGELTKCEFEALRLAIDQLVADDEEEVQETITSDIGEVWVPTGASVAQLYRELRAEASVQASIRNKFFDRAAAAFKRGDGAAAKKLSAQGREANEMMKDLHRKAANAIFEARNPSTSPDVIDLHGLHVSEAVERLPDALERAPEGKVRILTGTGHHTKGTGRARLRPAVKRWLQENSYYFSEVVDANDFVGSFVVEVKR